MSQTAAQAPIVRRRIAGLFVVMMALIVQSGVVRSLSAAPPGRERFAVDMVTLKSGDHFRGAVLTEADGQLQIAVPQNWLRSAHPKLHAELAAKDETDREAAQTQLLDRLKQWLAGQPEPEQLAAYLETELDRLTRQAEQQEKRRANKGMDGAGDERFLMVTLPSARIQTRFLQSPANRQVAVLSWREGLKDVEKREVRDLIRELEQRGLDPATEVVDLSDRLPRRPLTDAEWAGRRALVEYHFGHAMDFQGTGQALFRTDGKGGPPDLTQVLTQVLQDQVQSQLSGLLEETRGARRPAAAPAINLQPAIEQAQREDVRGFRVTQLQLDVNGTRATVQTQFVARMPDGQWRTVWSQTIQQNANELRAGQEAQIRNDPQVREVLKLAESLGAGGDAAVSTAVRFGAATMEAQQQADRAFFRFRDRNLRLDAPF